MALLPFKRSYWRSTTTCRLTSGPRKTVRSPAACPPARRAPRGRCRRGAGTTATTEKKRSFVGTTSSTAASPWRGRPPRATLPAQSALAGPASLRDQPSLYTEHLIDKLYWLRANTQSQTYHRYKNTVTLGLACI